MRPSGTDEPTVVSCHAATDNTAARLAGMAMLSAAWLALTGLDSSAKYLTASLAVLQIVFLRYAGGLIYSSVVVVARGVKRPFSTQLFGLQMARGLLLVASTALNFLALRYLRLDQTAAIMFSIPLITCALSVPFLGEAVGWRRWGAVCIGFIGVLIVLRPGFASFHWAMLFALMNAFLSSIYMLLTRRVTAVDSDETSMMYTVLIGTVLTLPFAVLYWQPLTSATIVPALLTGLFGGIGHHLIIVSHRLAPAPVIAPFSYTHIIWMTLAGYFLFNQLPDAGTLFGAAVVVSSGLFLIYREQQLGGNNPNADSDVVK